MTNFLNYLRKNQQFLWNISIFIFISIIFLLTFWKTGLLTSGFRYFVDEHQIPKMYHDLIHKGILQTIKEWIIADYNFNRFRPYYQAHIVVLTKIFGLRSTLWFSYIAILASLTFFFLFLFARNLNFSFLISLIFVIPMFLDVQSETWARPIIPDAHGMFFLSAALLSLHFCSKNNKYQLITNSIFMILVLLMSLCKESYIIFIPTLIVLKIWLYAENNKLSILQSLKVNIIGVRSVEFQKKMLKKQSRASIHSRLTININFYKYDGIYFPQSCQDLIQTIFRAGL